MSSTDADSDGGSSPRERGSDDGSGSTDAREGLAWRLAENHRLQVGFALLLLALAAFVAITGQRPLQWFGAAVVASYALARLYVLVIR